MLDGKLREKVKKNCPYFFDYYLMIENGDIKVCKENRQLCDLIIKRIDLQNIYTHKKFESILELIQEYSNYKLTVVQKFLHSMLYTYYERDGRETLAWKEYLLFCGRGFGKNSFISDAAFGLLSNRNGIKKYNVDIVATSEQQAKTSFKDVYDKIDDFPTLKRCFYRTKEEIRFINTASTMKYYTSNAQTKDGLRSGIVIFDEIHAYESYDNIKVFSSGLGKVPQPRILYTTTNGNVRGGCLDDFLEDAKLVLNEQDINAFLFPFICKIDKFEEWKDEECWEKANPMLRELPTLREQYELDFQKALKNEQMRIEFIQKRLNFTIEDTTTAVADWEDIKATNQDVDWQDFEGCSCVGAIDYASVRDFVAVGLLFKKAEKYYFKHHTFVTSESLKLNNFKIDLDLAVEKGLVTIVHSKTFDEEEIKNWFLHEMEQFNYKIEKVVADDYRVALLRKAFERSGVALESVRSGSISHTKISPKIEKLFSDHALVFGDDMMMRWYTNNVKVVTDNKGNKSYMKQEPKLRKTDGFMCFIHAMLAEDCIQDSTLTNQKTRHRLKTYTY